MFNPGAPPSAGRRQRHTPMNAADDIVSLTELLASLDDARPEFSAELCGSMFDEHSEPGRVDERHTGRVTTHRTLRHLPAHRQRPTR
jgi:hypothetical protein